MPELKLLTLNNGTIQYFSKIDAVPTTSEKAENVTVNIVGREEVPAHFQTSFMISVEIEEGPLKTGNVFHWNDVVPVAEPDAPYRSIEDQAARRIAPMLRLLADQIEADIARVDAIAAKKK